MRKSNGGTYPPDWRAIATALKDRHGWCCIRCGHPHDTPAGYTLTIHHADMNPANNRWWNLLCLCQRCHLQIQAKVIMERVWMFEHSAWFRPYVAGYYAFHAGLPDDEESVVGKIDELIALGQGVGLCD
jgi:hypothetical protein